MKIRVVLLLIIIILSLSACADVSVSYKLSDDNSLNINYYFSISPEDEDISGNISSIKSYWKDMGLSVEDSEKDGIITLKGDKTINCDSRGSAVKELSSILTDNDSLFYDVKFIYTPSYFEDVYDISASISLKDIIRKGQESSIPSAETESILREAKKGNYKLSITLPGEVQETNADEQNGQTCTWLLTYGETRQLKLVSKRVFEENVAYYNSLNETHAMNDLLFIISCAAAGFLLLLIIIISAVRRAKANRIAKDQKFTWNGFDA